MVRCDALVVHVLLGACQAELVPDEEATVLLQSGVRSQVDEDLQDVDDDDVGVCATEDRKSKDAWSKGDWCEDQNSMSGFCLRAQPTWEIPSFFTGKWNCKKAAKFCGDPLWMYDVTKCCPGVCTKEELYRAAAPQFDNGGIGGCQASSETCTDCAGVSNMCLHSRPKWNPNNNCENSKKWCTHDKWGKDMLECCPGVCNTVKDEDTGTCILKGCSESTGACTDCNDYSDLCLRYLRKDKKATCERGRDNGWCNSRKKNKLDSKSQAMLTCCPGFCETEIDTEHGDVIARGRCGRIKCQGSDETCTDCNQNSDKCIASRRGKKQTCYSARLAGMCTRDGKWSKKKDRTWQQDMLECCPKECGAEASTDADGQATCALTGCQTSEEHCANCEGNSDRCMQATAQKWRYKKDIKYTCKFTKDKGWCSSRRRPKREAMNNCCPGICKGPHPEEQLLPDWAICRGGDGNWPEDLDEHELDSVQAPEAPADEHTTTLAPADGPADAR